MGFCHKGVMRPGALVLELGAAMALFVAVAPLPARAAEVLLARPSACAIEDELPVRAERVLGQPLATAAPVRCTIQIERAGDAFAAEMELSLMGRHAAAGKRSFSAPTCELLAETLALAVALAVGDGERRAGATSAALASATVSAAPVLVALPPAALSPAALSPAAVSSAAVSSAAVSTSALPSPRLSSAGARLDTGSGASDATAPRREGLHAGVRAGLVADAGTLPGLGAGVALGLSFGGDWVDARAHGTYLAPREAERASRQGAGAEFELLAGGLALCTPSVVRSARLRAGACLGAELGVLSASARGFSESRRGEGPWRAGRLDVEGHWALTGAISVDLALIALAPLDRPRFVVEELEPSFVGPWSSQVTLHRPGPIVGRASIGLSFALDGDD
jgi:hypothetical protein